jgi:hypothetical protein
MMQLGIDNFVAAVVDPDSREAVGGVRRMSDLLEEIELADRVGLDSFGVAARTKRIRLNSAVTVLSAADPVRVFQWSRRTPFSQK